MGELRTQGREHERPVGAAGGKQLEGHLEDFDLVGIDDSDGAVEPTIVGQRGGHQSLGVAEVGCPASGVEEGVAKCGISDLALGRAEPYAQVDCQERIGVCRLGVEVEGLCVVAEGVARCQGVEGGVGRPAPIVEGLGQVSGLDGVEPVAGQLAKPVLGAVPEEVFEGFGHLAMGPGKAGGTQVRIQGVLDEGVGEVVAPRFPRTLTHQCGSSSSVEHVE